MPPKSQNLYRTVNVDMKQVTKMLNDGPPALGIISRTHAAIVGLNPWNAPSHEKKIIEIDRHVGIVVSERTSDNELLISHLFETAKNYVLFPNDDPLPLKKVEDTIHHKMVRRVSPLMCSFIVAVYENKEPIILQVRPDNIYECDWAIIGTNNNGVKNYVSRHSDRFLNYDHEELMQEGIKLLASTLDQSYNIKPELLTVGIVGQFMDFQIVDSNEVARMYNQVRNEIRSFH